MAKFSVSHDGYSYLLPDLKNNGVSVLIGKLKKISGPDSGYRLMVIEPNGACRESNPRSACHARAVHMPNEIWNPIGGNRFDADDEIILC